jgi:hypothetical protein
VNNHYRLNTLETETELDGPAVGALRRATLSVIGWMTKNLFTLVSHWMEDQKFIYVGQSLDGSPKIYLRWSVIGWMTKYLFTLVSHWMDDQKFIILSSSVLGKARWSRLQLQTLASTNPLWAHVGYGPFSLCVIHKEGLCSSSGDVSKLIMMMKIPYTSNSYFLSFKFIIDTQKSGLFFLCCWRVFKQVIPEY